MDLCCGGGGASVGLQRAGFEVTGVDIHPMPHHRGGRFIQADALTFPLEGYDFIWASPPCQRFSSLRHLTKGKEYPDLIQPIRERLIASGTPYCIENVEGAPLGASGFLIMLCGTMFGLQTPDGRAEIRRHRLFETSFSIPLRPACQHGHVPITVSGDRCNSANTPRRVLTVAGEHPHDPAERHRERRRALSVTGHSYHTVDSHPDSRPERKAAILEEAVSKLTPGATRRRAMSVTGHMAQTNLERNTARETFTIDEARHAMGIPWMPMRYLSQAIPPVYATFIGLEALDFLKREGMLESGRRRGSNPPRP